MSADLPISPTCLDALRIAAKRERDNVCPILGVSHRGGVETLVLRALDRRGLIDRRGGISGHAPYINDAGRRAVARADAEASDAE